MKKISDAKAIRVCFAALLIFFVGLAMGCEAKKMTDPKAELQTVAADYWDKRLMEKDYKATYKMEMGNDAVPYEEYLKRAKNFGQIGYMKIEIKDVTVDQGKGSLVVRVICNIPAVPKPMPLKIHDSWVVDKNRWKHVMPKK
ncbi:MAG: hypothetical protein GY846_09170 [Deltaproteobacteria bacterium]|nr:hypothetical protein [Deltaproteobacteria bacterium]